MCVEIERCFKIEMDEANTHFIVHFKMQLKCFQNTLQNGVWEKVFKMNAFQNEQI